MSIVTKTPEFSKVITLPSPTRIMGGIALGKTESYRYMVESNAGNKQGLLKIYTGVTARGTYELKTASNAPSLGVGQHANGLTYNDEMLFSCTISHHICQMKLSTDGTSVTAGAWYETIPNTGKEDIIGSIAHISMDNFLVRHHDCNFGVYQFDQNIEKYKEISSSGSMKIEGLENCFESCFYDSKGNIRLTMNDIAYKGGYMYLTFWDDRALYPNCNGKKIYNYIVKVAVEFGRQYVFKSMKAVESLVISPAKENPNVDSDLRQFEVEGIALSNDYIYFCTNGSVTDASMYSMTDDAEAYSAPNRDGLYKIAYKS